MGPGRYPAIRIDKTMMFPLISIFGVKVTKMSISPSWIVTTCSNAQIVGIQCQKFENAKILMLGLSGDITLCSTKIRFFLTFQDDF